MRKVPQGKKETLSVETVQYGGNQKKNSFHEFRTSQNSPNSLGGGRGTEKKKGMAEYSPSIHQNSSWVNIKRVVEKVITSKE